MKDLFDKEITREEYLSNPDKEKPGESFRQKFKRENCYRRIMETLILKIPGEKETVMVKYSSGRVYMPPCAAAPVSHSEWLNDVRMLISKGCVAEYSITKGEIA